MHTEKSPFSDAVAVWHMADLNDSAGDNCPLTIHGDVEVGAALTGAAREDSMTRGGDGYAAEFKGGYLIAGQDAEGAVNLSGKAMTFCIRMRDPLGRWNSPLFGRYDRDDPLGGILYCVDGDTKPLHYLRSGKKYGATPFYHMFAEEGETRAISGSKAILEFRWRTQPNDAVIAWCDRSQIADPILSDARNGVLSLCVPVELIGPTDWHDVVVRFNCPHLELFVDGVLVDEEWPYGSLYGFSAPFVIGAGFDGSRGFHGMVDHVALWNRALTDDEIARLSGGTDPIAGREAEILGEENASLQYWRPRGHNTYAGDCMPFFHDETFHLFWLFDRRHHTSKWCLGAHQYAHASTTDLVHWEHHPLAVPIDEQWECAMGTGEMICHGGMYYMFYTDCGGRCEFPDKPQEGSGIFMSTSTDGIHFTKAPRPVVPGGDCTIFKDKTTGLFHLLTPGSTDDGLRAIIHYVSPDVRHWTKQPEPFLDTAGACPHHFNGTGGTTSWWRDASGNRATPWGRGRRIIRNDSILWPSPRPAPLRAPGGFSPGGCRTAGGAAIWFSENWFNMKMALWEPGSPRR